MSGEQGPQEDGAFEPGRFVRAFLLGGAADEGGRSEATQPVTQQEKDPEEATQPEAKSKAKGKGKGKGKGQLDNRLAEAVLRILLAMRGLVLRHGKGKGKGKDAWLLAMRGLGFEAAIIDDDSSDIDDGFWGDATDEVEADNQLRADARTAERGA